MGRSLEAFKKDGSDQYEIVFIGPTTQHEEHQITLFKSAALLEQIGVDEDDEEYGNPRKDKVIEAIRELNDECEGRLITLAEVKSVKAMGKEAIERKAFGFTAYCEKPELSLETGGVHFNALYVPPDTPSLTVD